MRGEWGWPWGRAEAGEGRRDVKWDFAAFIHPFIT